MTGIYKITNLINNKIYIGQSKNIKLRYKAHLYNAFYKGSPEYNTPLHRAIYLYGKNNFQLDVLKICSLEQLNKLEQYYISLYDSTNNKIGYNLTLGGDNGRRLKCKSILQYDLKGCLIQEWNSIWEAAESLSIQESNIRACCCGQKSAGGFQWKYKEDPRIIEQYNRNTYYAGLEQGRKSVPIKATSIKTGEEYTFQRIKDAAEWLIKNKISKNSIAGLSSRISTIKNTPSIGYGFKWNTIEGGK